MIIWWIVRGTRRLGGEGKPRTLLRPAVGNAPLSLIGRSHWHAAGIRGPSAPRTPVGMTQRRTRKDQGRGEKRATPTGPITSNRDGFPHLLFSFLITGVQGSPLPKEVWNPRRVP